MKKRTIVISLVVCAGLAGIYFAGMKFLFSDSKEMHAVYSSCMATKPGTPLSELQKMFVSADIEHDHGATHEYWFGSHDYSVLNSAYIVATVNKATGEVIRLSCGEGAVAWDKRLVDLKNE